MLQKLHLHVVNALDVNAVCADIMTVNTLCNGVAKADAVQLDLSCGTAQRTCGRATHHDEQD